MIGIIGAMKEEVESLKSSMVIVEKSIMANMEFYKGVLFGKEAVVVVSGIGKVNAAVCTQILCDIYKIDTVINVGVAGGIDTIVKPGDIVVATSLVQHDMDCTVFGDKAGQIPRMDVYDFKCDENLVNIALNVKLDNEDTKIIKGIIATGDQFIANTEKIRWIQSTFNASAVEMESASIAQVAYLNKKPFIIIRSISDNANTGAHIDFGEFVPIAVKNSTQIVKGLLENI